MKQLNISCCNHIFFKSEDSDDLKTWIDGTNHQWTSGYHDIINEILSIPADNVRNKIADKIKQNIFIIIVDETIDLSKKKNSYRALG